eukprot:g12308.t1
MVGGKKGSGKGYGSEVPSCSVDFYLNHVSQDVRRHISDCKSDSYYAVGRRGYPAFRSFPFVLRPLDEDLTREELEAHTHCAGGGMPLPGEVIAKWTRAVRWVLWECPTEGIEEAGRPVLVSTNRATRIEDARWPEDALRIRYEPAGEAKKGREELLSRHLSATLRHAAERMGLKMVRGGFVRLEDIINHKDFYHYSPRLQTSEIHGIVEANQKQRFELATDMRRNMFIRCTQGHSVQSVRAEEALTRIRDLGHFIELCNCSTPTAETAGSGAAGAVNPLYPGVGLLVSEDEGDTEMLRTHSAKRPACQRADQQASGGLVPLPKKFQAASASVIGATSTTSIKEQVEVHQVAGGLRTSAPDESNTYTTSTWQNNWENSRSDSYSYAQKWESVPYHLQHHPKALAGAKKVVHGTFVSSLRLIIDSGGLKKMERIHIHFCLATADDIAGRRGASGMRAEATVIIEIDIAKCLADGIPFFISKNGVVLTAGEPESGMLPLKYFVDVLDRNKKTRHPLWTDYWKKCGWVDYEGA